MDGSHGWFFIKNKMKKTAKLILLCDLTYHFFFLGQLMQEVEFVREKSLKDEAEIEELKLKIQGLESTNHQLKIKLSESATVNVNCKDNFLRKQR